MELTSNSEVFRLDALIRGSRIWRSGLEGILEESNSQDLVSTYRERIELALKQLDDGMTVLLKASNSLQLLELWASRVKTCRHMTAVLDKNLAFKGRRQWRWNEVLDAMAMLEAVRDLTRRELLNAGIDC